VKISRGGEGRTKSDREREKQIKQDRIMKRANLRRT
jgi:hypothetical protein